MYYNEKIEKIFQKQIDFIDNVISNFLAKLEEIPDKTKELIKYSILSGGKRIRPIFLINVIPKLNYDNVLGLKESILAIELMHCASLIHDDLPAIDNDDFRRGKLTLHKKYGEGLALLTGDALQIMPFNILSNIENSDLAIKLIRILSDKAGVKGMIGGQILDISNIENFEQIYNIMALKTGALFEASFMMGGVIGQLEDKQIINLEEIGKNIGLLFQIFDDEKDKDSGEKANIFKYASQETINRLKTQLINSIILKMKENFDVEFFKRYKWLLINKLGFNGELFE
ncbi:polyprenyl synthetase family protein [Thermodesulfobium acidiphilum]|uniref:polyprenyl synthetase family protein n=1 Tax=Thermodesulfobium acidiphilum TaxID=1794699 RepID=UPI000D346A88|nr:polyprenyl synthetase family protein [Thermodesulfobium acidiphilum]